MVRAVTFDFWDTLVADESDEPRRAAAGLPNKREARWQIFRELVGDARPVEATLAAWDAANDHFRHQWKVEHHTPHIRLRLLDALVRLDLPAPTGFDGAVEAIAGMEVAVPPELAPGVVSMLRALRGRYRLGIISDTIVTPGAGLRRILAGYDMLDLFDAFVFSDEVGAAKPSPRVFDAAAAALECERHELAHVGDREANDIAGPLGVGATAILYTGVIDRGADATRATAVCTNYRDLPAILEALETA